MQCLEKQLAADAGDRAARLQLGTLLLEAMLYRDAQEHFRVLLLRNSGDIEALFHSAVALEGSLGWPADTVVNLLQRAHSLQPRLPRVGLRLGQVHVRRGQNDLAVSVLREVATSEADSAMRVAAHLELARVYIARGDTAEARTMIEDAARIDPAAPRYMRSAAVSGSVPAPRYEGPRRGQDGTGVHPPLEYRMQRLLDQIESGDESCGR